MTLTKDVPLTADMSVAPEIARLAEAVLLVPAQSTQTAPPESPAEHRLTVGTLAGRLRSIAATPERWWGLVRFEPGRSVQITVEECAAYRAWLVVLPPGGAVRAFELDGDPARLHMEHFQPDARVGDGERGAGGTVRFSKSGIEAASDGPG